MKGEDGRRSSSKVIPWEPYKAAASPSPSIKGGAPVQLPTLVPYHISKPAEQNETPANFHPSYQAQQKCNGGNVKKNIVMERERDPADGEERKSSDRDVLPPAGQCCDSSEEIRRLRMELEIERELCAELKQLLVASMGDDLMCHVKSLSEDKVRLASNMNKFAAQLTADHDRAEDLKISSDMWRCKFLAMSVRADELLGQRARLLTKLKEQHALLSDLYSVLKQTPNALSSLSEPLVAQFQSAVDFDVSSLCERTPCDEKVQKSLPLTSNITVACCKNCAGKEIKLL